MLSRTRNQRLEFLEHVQKLLRLAAESHRATPRLRVVVSHDHTRAVENDYVRTGGN